MRTAFILCFMSLVFISCTPAFACEPESFTLSNNDVISVHDGDTFNVNIRNIPAIFGTNVPVRIVGIDTPELASKCSFPMERLSEVVKAKEAREFVKAMLSNAKEITLANVARDKYFRVLADVYVDGVSLSELLIENKLAFSYDGGTKRSWCGE